MGNCCGSSSSKSNNGELDEQDAALPTLTPHMEEEILARNQTFSRSQHINQSIDSSELIAVAFLN